MDPQIEFVTLSCPPFETTGICFLPETQVQSSLAIFTHGYTSHKASLLTWAERLSLSGIPTMVFDLPGHYLGKSSEVQDFNDFQKKAPELFVAAHKKFLEKITHHIPTFSPVLSILGGHSLGGLLSLMAGLHPYFAPLAKKFLCVGLGLAPENGTHLFETKLYERTLNIRRQLVSQALAPQVMFPWIKKAKEELTLTNQDIYLLTGQDDSVVGPQGAEKLKDLLEKKGNRVKLDKPSQLPHHRPELASVHLDSYLKKS